MGGVDALVFTAGIGEHAESFRAMVVDGLEFFGLKLDEGKNQANQTDLSHPQATVKTLVIPTNEELQIALECLELIEAGA